jgi:hypothetical protein
MRTPGQKASRKQEAEVAADNDGQQNPGSGNGWVHKRDIRSPNFLFECKTTEKGSVSLKRRELDDLEKDALASGREPVWVNDIQGKRFITIPDYLWQTLRGD